MPEPIAPTTSTPAAPTSETPASQIPSIPQEAQITGREPTAAELKLLGLDTDPVEFEPKAENGEETETEDKPVAESFVEKALNIASKKPGRQPRTFEGLDEREQGMFNNMNREAYEYLYPLYSRLKKSGYTTAEALDKLPGLQQELETLRTAQQPQSYYDSPEAYLLDETYRTALVEQSQAATQAQYWTEQLAKCRAQQPFNGLSRDAYGNLTPEGTFQPTAAAEARIMALISESQQESISSSAKLKEITSKYKSSYDDYVNGLKKYHDAIYGPFESHLKDEAAKELEVFPAMVRGRPEVRSLAYAHALIKKVISAQKADKQEAAAASFTKKAATSAGPRQATVQASPKPMPDAKALEEDYKLFKQKFQV